MNFYVNNTRWDIKYVPPNSEHLKNSLGICTLGVCDNSQKTIFLSNRLSGKMLDKVICHELTHVYSFENDYVMDIQTEEIVADFMSLFGRDIIYLADEIMGNLLRRIA